MPCGLRLVIRRGDTEVASVIPGDRPVAIGRSKRCDIVLDDSAISRFHAVLAVEDEGLSLTDQDSQNGLWVHGRRVKKVWLKPDLPVVIGPFRVTIETAAAQSSASSYAPGVDPVPIGPPPAPAASSDIGRSVVPASRQGKKAATGRRSMAMTLAAIGALLVAATVGAILFFYPGMWRGRADRIQDSTAGSADAVRSAAVPAPDLVSPRESGSETAASAGVGTQPAGVEQRPTPAVSEPASDSPAGDAGAAPIIPAGRRAGESTVAWRKRSRDLTARYQEGKAALERGDLANGIQILSALEQSEPGFGDTAALLAGARSTIRDRARAALAEGARLEAQNNLADALASYERALKLNPDFSEARAAESGLRERIRSSADETFRKASVEDAFGRTDRAAALYKRVVELLPDGDPTREKAEARLTALQVNKP